MTIQNGRTTPARYVLPALILAISVSASCRVFAADIPPAYDHPFTDRMILEQESLRDVLSDGRCQHAWDAGLGRVAYACSWRFNDPLNPGRQACHVICPDVEEGVWTPREAVVAIRIETANCNGWHDEQAHVYGG